MNGGRKCKSGDEVDVHSKVRRLIVWKRGEVSKIKRRSRRRERHEGRVEVRRAIG